MEAGDIFPVVLIVVLLLLSLAPLYIYACADPCKTNLTAVTAALTMGQLASAVQALGVFREMDVEWEGPVAGVIDFMKLFAFDLDVIKLQCVLKNDDPIAKFLVTLLIFPMFMLALACMVGVLKAVGKPGLTLGRYVNSMGFASVIVYTSITITVLRPFHCTKNPNEAWTMASSPGIVCWESATHHWLVGLGIVGLLAYPIAILGNVVQVTLRYPWLVTSGHGRVVLDRYRFLFNRFTQTCYFWGSCYLLRNLLIALAPAIFPESAVWQVLMVDVILSFSLFATIHLMPWRTTLANGSELGITVGLAMFIDLGAFFLTPTSWRTSTSSSTRYGR